MLLIISGIKTIKFRSEMYFSPRYVGYNDFAYLDLFGSAFKYSNKIKHTPLSV